MASVDEVLAAMGQADAVSDSAAADFVVDGDLRVIAVPESGVVLGVVGDRDANRVRLLLPASYRGTDLSGFAATVSWVNAGGESGSARASVSKSGPALAATWLVGAEVLRYVGTVTFALRLSNASGSVVWNTTLGTARCLVGMSPASYVPQGLDGGRDLWTLLAGEVGSGTVWDALHARVARADWSGLRVGDYVDVPLADASGVTSQQSVRFLVAHFDPYYKCGAKPMGHHVAFIADMPITVSKNYKYASGDGYIVWNATATNQGTAGTMSPYLCSALREWEDAFEACLPGDLAKYLLERYAYLEQRYSASGAIMNPSGASNQVIGKVWSPSEMEAYGCASWGAPGYTVGSDCQLDVLRDSAHRLNGFNSDYWTRTPVAGSASEVSFVSYIGESKKRPANANYCRPRPCFLLG